MNSSAPRRDTSILVAIYSLAGVAMLTAVLLVLLDLVYVGFRSRGGPDQGCSAALLHGTDGTGPAEHVAGHRSWWPPSVVCEYPTADPTVTVTRSLAPGSEVVFWTAVVVFTAGFLTVAAICLARPRDLRSPRGAVENR
jgi:hypothetical protein